MHMEMSLGYPNGCTERTSQAPHTRCQWTLVQPQNAQARHNYRSHLLGMLLRSLPSRCPGWAKT